MPPKILGTPEKKKEKQNEKGRNIFLTWKTKGKENKGIKNEKREKEKIEKEYENGKTKEKKEKHGKKLKEKTKIKNEK